MAKRARMTNEARMGTGARTAKGHTQTERIPVDTAPPRKLLLKDWPGAPPVRRFYGRPR